MLVPSRQQVYDNIVVALQAKFGDQVQADPDTLNNSYLIYIGSVTIEVTFNEDTDSDR